MNVGRPLGQHIDNAELDALVPTGPEIEPGPDGVSSEVMQRAQQHMVSCGECREKVWKYWLLVNQLSIGVPPATPPGAKCPTDVDWYEVAFGLWPEFKATQLLAHAALCEHCGPLLRAAARLNGNPTSQEEKLLQELRAPAQPVPGPARSWRLPWQMFVCLTAALALVVMVETFTMRMPRSPQLLSGQQLAEFAVATQRQHAQGSLALDIRSDSQQALNEWFRGNLPFSLALPARTALPDEQRPYRLEGARLVQLRGKSAVFIAYYGQTANLQAASASLLVVPDSLATASGGTEAAFKKVTFHYSIVEGYKVVTWSLHHLTYVLVSNEGSATQRSCMVCHAALRDRDLSGTTAPLPATPVLPEPLLQ